MVFLGMREMGSWLQTKIKGRQTKVWCQSSLWKITIIQPTLLLDLVLRQRANHWREEWSSLKKNPWRFPSGKYVYYIYYCNEHIQQTSHQKDLWPFTTVNCTLGKEEQSDLSGTMRYTSRLTHEGGIPSSPTTLVRVGLWRPDKSWLRIISQCVHRPDYAVIFPVPECMNTLSC